MTEMAVDQGPQPRVSIIIPCLNGERFLAEAISSALAQSHENVEVIYVDDGSTDRSLEIARSFAQVTVLSQANAGISVARNAGLDVCDGAFVVFLDADDRMATDAVRDHLEAFAGQPAAPMVYGASRIIDEQGEVIEQIPVATGYMTRDEILVSLTPNTSQSMFRRDAVEAAGRFTPGVILVEDFDLYLRISRDAGLYCHGRLVADYRRHPDQVTRRLADNLVCILEAIDRFLPSVDDRARRAALRKTARATWIGFFGQYIPFEVAKSLRARAWRRAARATAIYARFLPGTAVGSIRYLAARVGRRAGS